jgi:hypothetical protein
MERVVPFIEKEDVLFVNMSQRNPQLVSAFGAPCWNDTYQQSGKDVSLPKCINNTLISGVEKSANKLEDLHS